MLTSNRFRAVLKAMIAIAVLAALGMHAIRLAIAGKPSGGGTTTTYTLTDLKGFSDGSGIQGYAYGVGNPDAAGIMKIVGGSYRADRLRHAALWQATAAGAALGLTDLGTPNGESECAAVDVNDNGLIVGTYPAFVVIPGIGLKVLPSIYGSGSEGFAVNNRGDVIGYTEAWHVDALGNVTGPVDLGTFIARDINDGGVMAGAQNGLPAIAWFDASAALQVQMLGVLPGNGLGSAYAINNLGAVVGESREYLGNYLWRSHAFLWTPANGMIALGDLGGGASIARDINDNGLIVGNSFKSGSGWVAFLWQNGTMSDLNALSGAGSKLTLIEANAINATGHIVGYLSASLRGGGSEDHAYLLTRKP
jgi:probable HAF family extracellular repeat protein